MDLVLPSGSLRSCQPVTEALHCDLAGRVVAGALQPPCHGPHAENPAKFAAHPNAVGAFCHAEEISPAQPRPHWSRNPSGLHAVAPDFCLRKRLNHRLFFPVLPVVLKAPGEP
jgi:hypothetical protein